MRYLEDQVRTRPDRWPSLNELADVACLSRYHFIRLYRHAVGELPQQTLRHLKLDAARELLARTPRSSVIDVALDHGYESPQAFARAYRAFFGITPRATVPEDETPLPVDVRFVCIPALHLQVLTIDRERPCVESMFDELVAHLDMGGVPRMEQDMLALLTPDRRFDAACALGTEQVRRSLRLPGRETMTGPGLRISGTPDAVWRKIGQVEDEWRAWRTEHPIILRYLNDPSYCVSRKQHIELYVPLANDALRAPTRHLPQIAARVA